MKIWYTGIIHKQSEIDHTRSFLWEEFAKKHPSLVEDEWVKKKDFESAVKSLEGLMIVSTPEDKSHQEYNKAVADCQKRLLEELKI